MPVILFFLSSCSTCCRNSLWKRSVTVANRYKELELDEVLLIFAASIDRRCRLRRLGGPSRCQPRATKHRSQCGHRQLPRLLALCFCSSWKLETHDMRTNLSASDCVCCDHSGDLDVACSRRAMRISSWRVVPLSVQQRPAVARRCLTFALASLRKSSQTNKSCSRPYRHS